jgi:hypothetical protein
MKINKNYLIILYSIILLIVSCKNELGKNELGKDGLIGASFNNEEVIIRFIDKVNVEFESISNKNKVVYNYSFDKINSYGRFFDKPNQNISSSDPSRIYEKPEQSNLDLKFNLIKSETDINKTKIVSEQREYYFNEKISKKKFILNNKSDGFKFSSLKKYIPFTEKPCKNLEGVYHGIENHLITRDLLIYTLKENKTEFYDGTVRLEIDKYRGFEIFNGVYRKIGEEVEIELFEEDGKTIKGLKKFRIERDQKGCILKLKDGLELERQP